MRIAQFDPDISYKIRLVSAYFDMEPSAYVRHLLDAEFVRLAEANELLRLAFNHKP
jgi:hypothetical protein